MGHPMSYGLSSNSGFNFRSGENQGEGKGGHYLGGEESIFKKLSTYFKVVYLIDRKKVTFLDFAFNFSTPDPDELGWSLVAHSAARFLKMRLIHNTLGAVLFVHTPKLKKNEKLISGKKYRK